MTQSAGYVGGLHAVKALLVSKAREVKSLCVQSGRQDARMQSLLDIAHHAGLTVNEMSRSELDQLAGNRDHQGILAQYSGKSMGTEQDFFTHLSRCEQPWFVLVLDGIQDPHNLGACLRSADAAGVHAVVTPIDNAVGLTPAVRKVASGAAETVALFQVPNLQRLLKKCQTRGAWVHGAADDAEQQLYDIDWTGSVVLVMGAEGQGMRRLTRQTCDGLFRIPMLGTVSSLNVSVATGVTLFEVVRQRQ